MSSEPAPHAPERHHGFTNAIVRTFLGSNLSLILIILAAALGIAALGVTPREEDPQIVVPLADVLVNFPGHSATEVEQLVATPLERLLYHIDGVEYVYATSREGHALLTVRFYVGEDRERSLVKLYKKIDENLDIVPPGVSGWVVKPVEIDDVPIVTLTLTGRARQPEEALSAAGNQEADAQAAEAGQRADAFALRRVAEELVERLAAVKDVSRAYVVGGQPRVVHVRLDPDQMQAHHVAPLDVQNAIEATNVTQTAGDFSRLDAVVRVEAGEAFARPDELRDLVVAVFDDRPVFLKDVAEVIDGPEEAVNYVRHAWGPARGWEDDPAAAGAAVGGASIDDSSNRDSSDIAQRAAIAEPFSRDPSATAQRAAGAEPFSRDPSATAQRAAGAEPFSRDPKGSASAPAVTIALSKKKGSNAVWVADAVVSAAETLQRDVVPDDVEMIVTRNAGLTSNEKVNELVEALAVAVFIVIALLTIGLGWRESLIVAVAVPVVFGLTLMVNLLFGYTINRVTLFALILSLGLLVDDPIVDVENISRHFSLRRKATRHIVLEAVAEIRPPLITATLAVIVSFLPMFFITGMMGPYMRPMALNVPVAMMMSMVVAFTITPWLSYHVLQRRYNRQDASGGQSSSSNGQPSPSDGPVVDGMTDSAAAVSDEHGFEQVKQSVLYRLFYPLMSPLLRSRRNAWLFLLIIAALTMAAAGLAATRHVPLKMLPFDNKNELLLVLDFDEGTTLERSDAAVREFEDHLAQVPEVVDVTSYVGVASPMDFNGMVRHYYLRSGPNVADLRVNLVGKKSRSQQSHAVGLRLREDLTAIARRHGANLKIVETPPGPPVIASVVAEVTGRPDHSYEDLIAAAQTVRSRLAVEPGVVDVDDTIEAPQQKLVFTVDKEKAAMSGVDLANVAQTLQLVLEGSTAGTVRLADERNPLRIELRLPRRLRSSAEDLARVNVKSRAGGLVPLAELGRWESVRVDQAIYHKNLQRVVYVFAETAGRPPADAVVDVQADRVDATSPVPPTSAIPSFAPGPAERSPIEPEAPRIDADPQRTAGWVAQTSPKPLAGRTFLSNGSGVAWTVPDGIRVDFAGEGEWKITLDVFRDLGLAFAAALVGIYILLVGQTRSFALPMVVMLAIPLTVLGIMPGFWLLNAVTSGTVGGYADPIFFTATGMIGMIALAGIVTRDAIILVDFIHLSLARGRSLFDAIMESRVVRLRPILLTAGTAMLSAAPIAIDPIFSGLAWSLIFGLFASTLFTLFVIPVAYWLLYAHKPGYGLATSTD